MAFCVFFDFWASCFFRLLGFCCFAAFGGFGFYWVRRLLLAFLASAFRILCFPSSFSAGVGFPHPQYHPFLCGKCCYIYVYVCNLYILCMYVCVYALLGTSGGGACCAPCGWFVEHLISCNIWLKALLFQSYSHSTHGTLIKGLQTALQV